MSTRPGPVTLSPKAVRHLVETWEALGAVLAEIDPKLVGAPPRDEPPSRKRNRRKWQLLNEVRERGGSVNQDEWRKLGQRHGYKPNTLGGFFHGSAKHMQAV